MTSLLTLVSIEHSNTGTYTCTANTTGGVVNEDTAYLEVMGELLTLYCVYMGGGFRGVVNEDTEVIWVSYVQCGGRGTPCLVGVWSTRTQHT